MAKLRFPNFLLKTTKEMADELCVEPDTLRRWAAADRDFPQPTRIGKRVLRWYAPEVMAYVERRGRPRGGCSS